MSGLEGCVGLVQWAWALQTERTARAKALGWQGWYVEERLDGATVLGEQESRLRSQTSQAHAFLLLEGTSGRPGLLICEMRVMRAIPRSAYGW